MGKAPAARTALISAGVKSPSGPTQTQTEFGGRFRSERTESKCSRGCRASFWRDAIKVSSNFSPRARNAWGATGASIRGSQAQPHCLRASTAVVCHFSRGGFRRHLGDRARGKDRHDPARAEFRCLLHDQLHRFSLRDGLCQRHRAGRWRAPGFLQHLERDGAAVGGPHFTQQFISRAIEDDHPFERAYPQNAQGMMRVVL